MKTVLLVSAAVVAMVTCVSSSILDCNFDEKRAFCQWRREWFGMRRAGWRSAKRLSKVNLEDHTTGKGKFIYFLARSRPRGFRSRIRSTPLIPQPNSCFVFWLSMGGANRPFPKGNSMLKLYVVDENEPVEAVRPIWTRGKETINLEGFNRIEVSVDEAVRMVKSLPVQFVLETIRGKSKRGYVAIDDISLQPCDTAHGQNKDDFNIHEEAQGKKDDMKKKLERLMLPARWLKRIGVIQFHDSESGVATALSNVSILSNVAESYPAPTVIHEHALVRLPVKPKKNRKGKRKGRKGKKRRRRRKNRNQSRGSFGNVLVDERLHEPPRHVHDVHLAATHSTVDCDFIEYTQRLHRCFRSFFSMLRKRPRTCEQRYVTLESCLRSAAVSCVSPRDMDTPAVEEIVIGSLRNNFMTRKVFCEEEGAFVYPKFSVAKLPIQCGDRYFIKLSECSSSFSNIFQLQHGNPKLCKEYYQANECQRQTTADECNFDSETMLLYGLNLQYQFAHNPFCLHLPFSSWWPES